MAWSPSLLLVTRHNKKIGLLVNNKFVNAAISTTPKQSIQPLTVELQVSNSPCAEVGALYRENRLKEAVGILDYINERSIPLNSDNAYASLLQACANLKSLARGKQVHAQILANGFQQNVFLGTKLVSMYATCGSFVDASLVFDKIPKLTAFSWNAMIAGHVLHGHCEEALTIYYQMQREGTQPDNFTFPLVLKACADLVALQQGKDVHDYVRRLGFEANVHVGNALVAMYGKCGDVENARKVFEEMPLRSLVTWNSMIAGYAQNKNASEALDLFSQMQFANVKPDALTISGIVLACANLADLRQGKGIHDYIIRRGFESVVLVGNALIDMYSKCRSVEFARKVFDQMSERDTVSWTSLIAGYAHNGSATEALKIFRRMLVADMKLDTVTITSVLPAIAYLAALQQGKEIHGHIIRIEFKPNVFVGSALIDMYAKCGRVDAARNVFDRMSQRNVVAWTAMIVGYGMHGRGEDALTLFNQMQQAGVKPNHITFIGVLSACSHAGLVDEGKQYFDCMSRDYRITPQTDHYACMVDLLGRVGNLDAALDFIKKMPFEPGAVVWGALLGACRIHCNTEIGEQAAGYLFDLEPGNSGNYVLLSNIYAEAGRSDDVLRVRTLMRERGLKKMPGCSWIEVRDKVHTFLVGDTSHPQSKKIYAVLDSLAELMEEAGYVPNTCFVLHDVEEEEKEYILCNCD